MGARHDITGEAGAAPARAVPRWLSPAVTRAIHARQVRARGGRLGARRVGLVEIALLRARARWLQDPGADIRDLAAAIGAGLARTRPFLDGNRRTARQAMYVFLGLNGWRLEAREADLTRLIRELGSDVLPEARLAGWLRRHTVRTGIAHACDGRAESEAGSRPAT